MKFLAFFKYAVSNVYRISVLLALVALVIGALVYSVNAYADYRDRQEFLENFQKSYYEDFESKDPQVSGFTAYTQLTEDEITSLTQEEKFEKALEISKNLIVYTLDFHVLTDFDVKEYCVKLDEFKYDGRFHDFEWNPKWRKFYGLDLFDRITYDVTYKSNVYLQGYEDFPLQYFEDYKPSFKVRDEFSFVKWDLRFDDGMQIVLPDKNSDKIPDDSELLLKVEIRNIGDNGEDYFNAFNIPLSLKSGYLQVATKGVSCR